MLGERNFYSELRKDFLHLPPAFKSGITPTTIAQMAELVDALDSKSGYRKVVQVRFLFWARFHLHSLRPASTAGFLVRWRQRPIL